MQTFITRAISAIVFAVLVIGAILYNEWTFESLFFIVSIACLHEFYKIIGKFFRKDVRFQPLYMGMALPMAIISYIASYLVGKGIWPLQTIALFPLLLSCFLIVELFIKSKRPFRNIGINMIGFIYIYLPFLMLHAITYHHQEFVGPIVFGVLLCVWTNDTGAYIIGSLIGRTKLIEHVSPKKTIEGSLGGALCTLGMAYIISTYLSQLAVFRSFSIIDLNGWLGIGVLVLIFASIGDLIESLMKRSLDIKDSGAIMPGHGGFLDRFDAFIFVMPFVVCFLLFYLR